MINIIDNFLEPEIIQQLKDKFNDSKGKAAFEVNEFGRWDPNLHVGNYGPVYMLPLNEYIDYFQEKCNKTHWEFQNATLSTVFMQIWMNGSGINWHHDTDDRVAATVYLNEEWNLNWGGLFLYQGENGTNSSWINPHYNRCVWFKSPLWHCVSLISKAAPYPRLSIQLFFERNSV
jgi:hypothetical protein